MYCENCGAKNDDDSKFCEHCGQRLEAARKEEESATGLDELMNMEASEGFAPSAEKTIIFRKPRDQEDVKTEQEEDLEALEQEEAQDAWDENPPLSEEPDGLIQQTQEPWPEQERDEIQSEAEASGSQDSEEEAEETQSFHSELEHDDWFAAYPEKEEPDIFELTPEAEREKTDLEEGEPDTAEQENPENLYASKWVVTPEIGEMFPSQREKQDEDEWLQAEIARTMRSLQQSSEDFFYEDWTGENETNPVEEIEAGEPKPEAEIAAQSEEAEKQPEPETVGGGAQALSYPPPNKASEEPIQLRFCMACGRRLPAGAAFCDACGTPTGEVTPPEEFQNPAGGSMAVRLLKDIFVKPAAAIEQAATDKAFLSGIGFFLLKDALMAVLAALVAGRLSTVLAVIGPWLLSVDPFGFGAKIFLSGVLMDILWIAAVLGAGRLFRAEISPRSLIGSCGTAGLFTAVLAAVTVLIAAFVPGAAICAIAVTGAVTVVTMARAIYAAVKLNADLVTFLMAAVTAVYTLVIFVLMQIV